MKILMTLMGLDIGGAETHVVELARELQRRGHQVLIASGSGAYVPVLAEAGIRHIPVPMTQRDPMQMLRAAGVLRQVIRAEQPDLVHAHARIPAFLCGLLQKQLHFPLITSAHWVFEVTPMLRLLTNWGDRTVAVSQDIRTYLMREYQVPSDQIHVTINGINTRAFSPECQAGDLGRRLGLGDGPVVCHVSRLDSSRSLAAELLLELWPSLLNAVPGVQLLLVGGGDQEQTLRRQAEAINRAAGTETVIMTGPRTDIAELLSLGDVFVGASRAVLEAMSEEKPALLAGNEGYMGIFRPELLEDAMAGNFCYRGHPLPTAEAMLEDLKVLLSMVPEERAQLGSAGRAAVLAHYSVERMTEDYLAAYDQLLHPVAPLRAVISGYYGYDNLGDDAILLAISREVSQLDPPVRLRVLSRRPDETRRRFGLKAEPRFLPLHLLKALSGCDLLISGGGSLLQDRTSTRSLRYYLAVIRLAGLLGKPVFLYANGIGPVERPSNRRAVARAVARCDGVTLRDQDSLEELRRMGVTREDMLVTADPAFTLTPEQNVTIPDVPAGRRLLGISVRPVAGGGSDPAAFAAMCDRLSRETGLHIVFLCMQEPADSRLSQDIGARMAEPWTLVRPPERPETMLGIIAGMEAVVAMRLHTIIFAAKARTPVVGCVYDPKVESFLKLLDMPSCGTPEHLDPDAAVQAVRELLSNREATRSALDRAVTRMEAGTALTGQALLRTVRHI